MIYAQNDAHFSILHPERTMMKIMSFKSNEGIKPSSLAISLHATCVEISQSGEWTVDKQDVKVYWIIRA